MLRRRPFLTLLVLLLSVGAVVALVSLPPRRISLSAPESGAGDAVPTVPEAAARPTVAGALHVHTDRSDGTGTMDEVAAAAAEAGLDFLVFSDHGDGTREPEPPAYRAGVLCLDGVEISTRGGHYLVIGLPVTPYPLAGEARDVVEDVQRLGGFGIAAHPGSPKSDLAWADWGLAFDALEWINGDSAWRDEPLYRLVGGLFHYLVRPPEAVAALLDRPVSVLARWDELTRARRVVAVIGSDAHARVAVGPETDPYGGMTLLKVPSYSAVFGAFAVRVELEVPPSGEAEADAERLLSGLRAGRVYSAVDAIASPVEFQFEGAADGIPVVMGDRVEPGAALRLRAQAVGPPGAQIVLLHNGDVVQQVGGGVLEYEDEAKIGAYRVEVLVGGSPGSPVVPWIVSNPIYVAESLAEAPAPSAPAAVLQTTSVLFEDDEDVSGWVLERSEESRAAVDSTPTTEGRELAFRLALGGNDEAYAAMTRSVTSEIGGSDRLVFLGRADRPLRVSVQLRAPDAAAEEDPRWQRSVYLDLETREITVRFDDMTPVGRTQPARPDLDAVTALLVVVDTVNTAIGTGAIIWFDDVRFARGALPASGSDGQQ